MEGDRDQSSSSSPLYWSQSRKASSFSAPPPSSGIRTWVLVLLVSIFVILFIPSFRSSNLLSFRPSFVKNGWDTLNLALVVFAILIGLLGRDVASGSGGGGEYKEEGDKITVTSPPPLTHSQHRWGAIGYAPVPEQSVYEANQMVGIRRFKSSSSYPDLRQELNNGDNWAMSNSWRFSDDIQLYRRRPSDLSEWEISGDPGVKTIQVDTFELKKSPSKSPPPPPPPPPPRPLFPQPTLPNRRTVKKLQHTQPATTSPPPPPPPPPPVFPEQRKKSNKKGSGAAAKDIATAIALFYTKKKRRSRAKKVNDEDSLASASMFGPPPPPPPPPPPLPSSSVFSQLFSTKKGGSKSRRSNSISDQRSPPAPPPPPPLPPKKEPSHFSDHRLPPRKRREKKPSYINTYPIAPPSPLPPAPPPPPPASDEDSSDPHFADRAKASPFCPSPDVNNKADVFIKHFRDGLKLEKLNSIREKQQRRQDQPQEMQQEAGIEMEMENQIMKMMMMGMEEDNWTLI